MSATKRILQQFSVLLALYSAIRILFFLVNRPLYIHSSPSAIVLACVNGIRYDLAALALINIVLFVLYLIPMPSFDRPKGIVLGTLFTLGNGFALSLNIIDVEYFRFTGKRLTMDSFLLARDIGDQTLQIALYYWYFSLLQIALYSLLAWLSFRKLRPSNEPPYRPRGFPAIALILTIALGSLAIRGGWQSKPLIPASAFAQNPELGSLVLNSTFTVLKSTDKVAVVELHDMTPEEVRKTIESASSDSSAPLPATFPKPKNIVVVILESFGSEYIFPPEGKPGYAPFLKSLAAKGSFFDNAYANGRRSIDALPALFAGIPQWMEPPFITSPYQTNQITGAPQEFKKAGYDTVFYHGGNNGTMFFDVMTKRLGFEGYVGDDQYPDQKDYDGKWGIFDEPFLQYMAKDLTHKAPPFLATVFTLSSHHPYTIPKEHANAFPKGTLEIHESVGYADFALQRFYESAQKEPWFKDTLFVFTGDHTSKQEYLENDTIPGRFHVPIIFIMNDQPLPFPRENLHSPVQHADLAATLFDMSRIKPQALSHFGASLCRPLLRPGIVLYEADGYHLVGNHAGTSWWLGERTQSFAPLDPSLARAEDAGQQALNVRYIKAYTHYYNNGMVKNQLIW